MLIFVAEQKSLINLLTSVLLVEGGIMFVSFELMPGHIFMMAHQRHIGKKQVIIFTTLNIQQQLTRDFIKFTRGCKFISS